jgi:small ligand-binding sensory domain FIST
LVFVTAGFHGDYGRIIERIGSEFGAAHLLGCSATHGIAGGRVLEGRETVTVFAVAAPGITVGSVALSPEVIERAAGLRAFPERQAEYLHRATGVRPGDVNGWILLADHASVEAPSVASMWASAWPGTSVIGAIASTSGEEHTAALFHGANVVPDGVVALAIGGDWTVETLASQGCASIGRPWTITEVDGEHAIRRIGRRPALGVLMETVRTLPANLVERARGNLFAGLAIDEVRTATSVDELVSCALLGADQDSGSILILGRPVVGQTVQFQYRDAAAATHDLEAHLKGSLTRAEGRAPLAAIVLADDARHEAFFGVPDRDASTVRGVVGNVALAGFGCRAELGPVGGHLVAMTHAACIGLLVPASERRLTPPKR